MLERGLFVVCCSCMLSKGSMALWQIPEVRPGAPPASRASCPARGPWPCGTEPPTTIARGRRGGLAAKKVVRLELLELLSGSFWYG